MIERIWKYLKVQAASVIAKLYYWYCTVLLIIDTNFLYNFIFPTVLKVVDYYVFAAFWYKLKKKTQSNKLRKVTAK